VALFKLGLSELDFDGAELAPENPDQEVPAAAAREGNRSAWFRPSQVDIASTIHSGVNTSPWSATFL
jgi:hypothetical protein